MAMSARPQSFGYRLSRSELSSASIYGVRPISIEKPLASAAIFGVAKNRKNTLNDVYFVYRTFHIFCRHARCARCRYCGKQGVSDTPESRYYSTPGGWYIRTSRYLGGRREAQCIYLSSPSQQFDPSILARQASTRCHGTDQITIGGNKASNIYLDEC